MLNKFETIAKDLKYRYEIACADADLAERVYHEWNFYVDELPVWRYIAERDHWDDVLDKAYNRLVNARKIVKVYEDALDHASKLYSDLQDLQEYGED